MFPADGDHTTPDDTPLATGLVLQSLRHSLRQLRLPNNAALTSRSAGTLPSRALGDLGRLQHLDLSACGLLQLRRRSFHGLERLQRLNLSANRLAQLQPEQFAALQRLRVLDLSGNRLAVVGGDVFARTRLEWLSVHGNQLAEWPTVALADVGFTLRSVAAARNRMTRLDASMFVHTPFVATIDVSGNQLGGVGGGTGAADALPFGVGALPNLTRLDLSDNSRLAGSWMQMVGAQQPHPAAAVVLHSVRQLRVAGVGLTALPARLMDAMPALAELDASGNRLTTVPATLRHARRLHTLRLAANRLQNWPDVVARLPLSLRVLDVSFNEGAANGSR